MNQRRTPRKLILPGDQRRTPRKLILPGDRQRSATEWCNAWLERNLAYCIAVMIGVLIYLTLCCS